MTRYATKSAEAADENQRRVEAVFAELAGAKPDNGTPRSGAPQATVRIRCASAGTVYQRGHCGIVRANCHLTLAVYNAASDVEKFMRHSLNAPDDRYASRASQLAQSVHQWVSSRRN